MAWYANRKVPKVVNAHATAPPGPVGTAGDAGLAPSSPRWTWSRTAARRTGGEEIFKADKWSVDSFARYVEDRIGSLRHSDGQRHRAGDGWLKPTTTAANRNAAAGKEGFADALAGMQEWSITVHDGICRCEFCVTGIALIEAALGDMAGILPPHPVRHRSRRSGSAQTPPPHRPGPGFTHRVLFREERSRSARGPHVFHHSPVGVGFIGGPGLDVAQVVGGDG